jgi:hypothetical protein
MARDKVYSLGARVEETALERKRNAEVAAQEASAQDELDARQQQVDQDERERQLADKYDLAAMYARDPALFPLEVAMWNILIEMVRPAAKFGGLIHKTPGQLQAEEYLSVIGKVIACGPTALEGKTESGIALKDFSANVRTPADLVGKYVIHQPHVGAPIWFAPLPGKRLKIITATEVLAITTNPTMFMKP